MSPERELATWWNALSVERRLDIARCLNLVDWECCEGPWSTLLPVGQQMYLHMTFDGVIGGVQR